RSLVLSDQAKNLMDEIRRTIADMEQEESALESRRAAEYSKGLRLTRVAIFLTTALAVLGVAMLAYYILREMDLRERHAAQMRAGEEWYRVTLTSIGDA